MKFGITRYELFALTSHLVGQPSPSPEHGRKRLRAWGELGVDDLADTLATMVAGFGGEILRADWQDKKTPHLVDINADVLDFLIAGVGVQVPGVWADTIARLRERLEALRDKRYELPAELRTLAAVNDG
jgi:hypothetical protein